MKKPFLILATFVLYPSIVQAAPEVYGGAFVTADYVTKEESFKDDSVGNAEDIDDSAFEINSHVSYIGFRGTNALFDATDLTYQLEYGLRIDGEVDTLESRDTYLGILDQRFGEFRFGRNSSVIGYVNNVTVTRGYWDNLGATQLESSEELAALNMLDEARLNNSILWIVPKYDDLPLQLTLQYANGEEDEDSNAGFGTSIMFDQSLGFTAGITYSKDMDVDGQIKRLNDMDVSGATAINRLTYGGDVVRLTTTTDLSKYTSYPLKLGILYQQTNYDYVDSAKEKGIVVSADMRLNNFARPASIYLQYNQTDNLNGANDSKSDQIVIGTTYSFADNMIAHAYAGQSSANYVRAGTFKNVENSDNIDEIVTRVKSDIDILAIGAGLQYLF